MNVDGDIDNDIEPEHFEKDTEDRDVDSSNIDSEIGDKNKETKKEEDTELKESIEVNNKVGNGEENNHSKLSNDQEIVAESLSQSESDRRASSNSPSVSPVPSHPRKRLSLQERLAMAAKGKKTRTTSSDKSLTGSKSLTSIRDEIPLSESPKATINEENNGRNGPTDIRNDIPNNGSSVNLNEAKNFSSDIQTPKSAQGSENQETSQESESKGLQFDNEVKAEGFDVEKETILKLKEELKISKATNRDLEQKLKNASINLYSQTSNSSHKDKKEWMDAIAMKDSTIEQLMEEGRALSVKELKLNETIKRLRSSNSELKETLAEYSEKSEKLSLYQTELDATLKSHKFKSIEQLIEKFNQTTSTLNKTEKDLETELSCNWQGKYKEQQKLYDVEMSGRKEAQKDLNELKIKFEMAHRQQQLEIDSKIATINDLRADIMKHKSENGAEIGRLESKIEQLRLENESSQDSFKNESENSKGIEYEDFSKLSDAHHNLQQSYLSSQENWKLIESNFLNQIDSLTAALESSKKQKQKLSNEMKRQSTSLQEFKYNADDLQSKLKEMTTKIENMQLKIQMHEEDRKEQMDKYEKLKKIYSSDRAKLTSDNSGLKSELESCKQRLSSILVKGVDVDRPAEFSCQEQEQQIATPPRNNSLNNNSWNEIKLGESSETPAMQNEYSDIFINQFEHNSMTSITGNESDDDLYSFQTRQADQSHIFNNSSRNASGINILSAPPTNSNIHLINKMSSNIRRLEIELHTLQEENNKVTEEKNKTQQELLSKLDVEENMGQLEAQVISLKEEIDRKSEKEQTMLELIGEKSEQVEELKADVQDLKDLLKLQVQQMIELQGK